MTICDGGPGLISALERVFTVSWRQGCLVHRSWNAVAKVSAADADEFKVDLWAIFDDVDADPGDPGDAAVAQARRHADEFASKRQRRYPGAVGCVTDDFDHLVAYLRFPAAHWRRIRHTNLLLVNRPWKWVVPVPRERVSAGAHLPQSAENGRDGDVVRGGEGPVAA